MFAAGSEADGSVPPYPSFSTPAVPSQSGTPTVLFDRDACRRKRATKKTIKNQKQRIESSSDSDLTQEEELSEVMEAGRKRGDQIMNWGSSEDDSDEKIMFVLVFIVCICTVYLLICCTCYLSIKLIMFI